MSDTDKYCENCRFYDKGHCRRYPPKVAQVGEPGRAKWVQRLPVVNHDDYCGEFVRNPAQLDIKSIPQKNRPANESLLNLPPRNASGSL